MIEDKTTYTFRHETGGFRAGGFPPKVVEVGVPAEVGLPELLSAFEDFLRACGFQFDSLEVVEREDDTRRFVDDVIAPLLDTPAEKPRKRRKTT